MPLVELTVRARWDEFKSVVINPLASPTQKDEMELAYFAGAEAVLGILVAMTDPKVAPHRRTEILKNLNAECRQFAERRGLAKPRGLHG